MLAREELADGGVDHAGHAVLEVVRAGDVHDRDAGDVGEPVADGGAVVDAGDAEDADRGEPAHAAKPRHQNGVSAKPEFGKKKKKKFRG